MDDENQEYDSVERVDNYSEGVKFAVDITRGTGTRDQEKWKIHSKANSADEALAEFEKLLTHFERKYGDRVRSFEPSDDFEGEDEVESSVGDFDDFDG